MMMRRAIFIAAILPISLSGCGGDDASVSFSRPAAERPDLDRIKMDRGKIAIPGGESFNFTAFRSGQTGGGRGECKAVGKDGAVCRAESTANGTATSEFQMGYCFDNTTDSRLEGVVRLRLNIDQKASVKGEETQVAGAVAMAKSSLMFVIKDTTGLTLKTESLLGGGVDKGAHDLTTRQDLVFDARFEPQRGYYLVLVGRADVSASDKQTASLSLEISKASLDISWKASKADDATPAKKPTSRPAAERS